MKLNIELNEDDLRSLILDHLQSRLGDIDIDFSKIKIEAKSKQNRTTNLNGKLLLLEQFIIRRSDGKIN